MASESINVQPVFIQNVDDTKSRWYVKHMLHYQSNILGMYNIAIQWVGYVFARI